MTKYGIINIVLIDRSERPCGSAIIVLRTLICVKTQDIDFFGNAEVDIQGVIYRIKAGHLYIITANPIDQPVQGGT